MTDSAIIAAFLEQTRKGWKIDLFLCNGEGSVPALSAVRRRDANHALAGGAADDVRTCLYLVKGGDRGFPWAAAQLIANIHEANASFFGERLPEKT